MGGSCHSLEEKRDDLKAVETPRRNLHKGSPLFISPSEIKTR